MTKALLLCFAVLTGTTALYLSVPDRSIVSTYAVKLESATVISSLPKTSFLTTLCSSCFMVTDSELNHYFTSLLNEPVINHLLESQAELVSTSSGQKYLCSAGGTPEDFDFACAKLDSVTRHGKSSIPEF